MDIVFMGTPDFAVPCLERLINENHNIKAVFTQPDKPKGRGHVLTSPEVKVLALKYKIPVYQPTTLKSEDVIEILNDLNPEIIIVVAYGKILPESIINLPKYGCINIHASLLPKYRGAAPIQRAVLNGDKVTGVTSMQMDAGLDTGDILLTAQTQIGDNETSDELWDRLSVLGSQIMSDTIKGIISGTITPQKQDDSKASYASMLSKDISRIDWNNAANVVHNHIRGLNSWPIATFYYNGKTIKVYNSIISGEKTKDALAGEVIESTDTLKVACGDGNCIELLTLQAQGRKRMPANDFLRGFNIDKGVVLK